MTPEEIIDFCMKHKKAYIDYPFGEQPVCVKVNKKIFAELYTAENNYKITLKNEPMQAEFCKRCYPGDVVNAYHCPKSHQQYWITAYINRSVPDSEVLSLIDQSYNQVLKSFSKRVQTEILSEDK